MPMCTPQAHHEAIDKMKEELLKYQKEEHTDCCLVRGCGTTGEQFEADEYDEEQFERGSAEERLEGLLQEAKDDYQRLKVHA